MRGYKSWLKRDPQAARAAADRMIKNTYRTLMTRGQKGCFGFSNAWLKARAADQPGSAGSLLMAAEASPPYESHGDQVE